MKQGEQTQQKIIALSSELFYHKGYKQTSFSDIVDVSGMSKGNITYHFKSKDDILKAVIEMRVIKTGRSLKSLSKEVATPVLRLNNFIDWLVDSKYELVRYGCPNATLAYELGKSDNLTRELSRGIFGTIQSWFEEQFLELGNSVEDAKQQATSFFLRAQGAIVLASVYNDEMLLEQQLNSLREMIESK